MKRKTKTKKKMTTAGLSPPSTTSPPSFPVRCVCADVPLLPAGGERGTAAAPSTTTEGTTPTPAPQSTARVAAASFGDVEWVAVSQTGALGSLVRAVPATGASGGRGPGGGGGLAPLPVGMEEDEGGDGDTPPPAPVVTTLAGRRDDPAAAALARLLLARLAAAGAPAKPLLLACALTDDSPAAVRAAATAVGRVWDG
jgi:hypothetical protein